DKLVLSRLLHRQVLGVRATKNAIDICSRASPLTDLVDTIGKESTVFSMKTKRIDRRQSIACGQVDNQFSSCNGMWCHNQTAVRHEGELCYAAFDFVGVVHAEGGDLYPQSH